MRNLELRSMVKLDKLNLGGSAAQEKTPLNNRVPKQHSELLQSINQ